MAAPRPASGLWSGTSARATAAYILTETVQVKGAQVVAVCDVKRDRREAAAKVVNDTYGTADCAMLNEFEEPGCAGRH